MENTNKHEKKTYRKMLIMSIASVCFFIIIEILNLYRNELFGIIPGYAPYNFAFNVGLYLPGHFIAFLLSIIVLSEIWTYRKMFVNKMKLLLPLFLSGAVFIVYIYFILKITVYTNYD